MVGGFAALFTALRRPDAERAARPPAGRHPAVRGARLRRQRQRRRPVPDPRHHRDDAGVPAPDGDADVPHRRRGAAASSSPSCSPTRWSPIPFALLVLAVERPRRHGLRRCPRGRAVADRRQPARSWPASGLALVIYAVIGVGIGALLRNQVGAIVGALVYLFVVEPIIRLDPGDRSAPTSGCPAARCEAMTATFEGPELLERLAGRPAAARLRSGRRGPGHVPGRPARRRLSRRTPPGRLRTTRTGTARDDPHDRPAPGPADRRRRRRRRPERRRGTPRPARRAPSSATARAAGRRCTSPSPRGRPRSSGLLVGGRAPTSARGPSTTGRRCTSRCSSHPDLVPLLLELGRGARRPERGLPGRRRPADPPARRRHPARRPGVRRRPAVLGGLRRGDVDRAAAAERGADADGGALHAAAGGGRLELVRLLIDAGADVDRRDPDTGRTPLHAAVAAGPGGDAPEIVEVLLAAGADVNATTNDGASALDISRVAAARHRRGDAGQATAQRRPGRAARRPRRRPTDRAPRVPSVPRRATSDMPRRRGGSGVDSTPGPAMPSGHVARRHVAETPPCTDP